MTKVEEAVFMALAVLSGTVVLKAAIYLFCNLIILAAKALGCA